MGKGFYIRTFLSFLPFYSTRRRNITVICANNHPHRIVINDKNVNHFQQIITFKGDFLKMKQQLRKEIGTKMRKIRKTLGYTQVQMVSFFEIGRANYSRIEKGEIFPTAAILNVLCRDFHVSLDWLIANEGEMFTLQKQKEDARKILDSGKYSQEISDLFIHIENVPMVRHAILSFFLEYKQKNQRILQEILEKNSPLHSSDRV